MPRSRFQGCLLGLAVGDALGGRFEGQSADAINSRHRTLAALLTPHGELWYTDDTQMAIGVAQTLIEAGEIQASVLCRHFVANYVPSRGYGRGARVVIEAMEAGDDYEEAAERYFPGGSYGNGAAMRVAPLGVFFRGSREALNKQARQSALVTHRHPLGIEGAQLLALAAALACESPAVFDRTGFLGVLASAANSDEYRQRLERAAAVTDPWDLIRLGNGIEALESVVTAIASFALTPDSYTETIGHVIRLGGDTDTVAAMAGALAGARLGLEGIPANLLGALEDGPQGRTFLLALGEQLAARAEVCGQP